MIEAIARFFCRRFHRRIMQPINGRYRCARCLREYPAWQEDGRVSFTVEQER